MAHTQGRNRPAPHGARGLSHSRGWWAALAAIVLLAAALRLTHLNWDGGQQLHPDERGILFVAQDIRLPRTAAELALLRSPLNPLRTPDGDPRPYPYGQLPLYLNAALARLLTIPCDVLPAACAHLEPGSTAARLLNANDLPRFDHLTMTGRLLAALADTLTVLATALLARALFGRRAGLLAAGFAALAVQHIQQAHFGTVDTLLGLFSTLAVWQGVIYAKQGEQRATWLAGAFAGLAVGAKAGALLLVVPLGTAAPLRRDARAAWRMAVGAALAFALTNPYALLDPGPYLAGLTTQARMASGTLDWPFTWAYHGTLPVWYGLSQQARWLLGPALTLAAVVGLVAATLRAIRQQERPLVVAVVWGWAALVAFGGQAVKFPRYLLPVTPTLFALAAGWLAADGTRRWARPRAAAAALTLAVTALYAGAFVSMYREPHPWVQATGWLHEALPPGRVLLSERGDDALPLGGAGGFDARQIDPLIEPGDAAALDALARELANADVLVIASRRVYGTVPRLAERYPLGGAYYRALFAGELGYTLEASFSRYPMVLGRPLIDDPFRAAGYAAPPGALPADGIRLGAADESFVVYDHPLALIFTNRDRLSAEVITNAIRRRAEVTTPR